MTSLKDLQQKFISDCLSGDLTDDNVSMSNDISSDTISAKGRMGIYRESGVSNIIIPLQMTYPIVEDLVGEEFFKGLCRKYSEKYWPKSGDMNEYGIEFAEFIETFEPAKGLPYLSDIAWLEWLFHLSSLADDKDITDWSKFAALSEEELTKVTIDLHPSVEIMTSAHPILKIWEMCKNGGEKTLDLSKEKGGHVLLIRKNLKVNLYPLADNEIAFIRSLIDGETLLEAYDKAIEINDNEATKNFITKHIEIGSFCSYKIK